MFTMLLIILLSHDISSNEDGKWDGLRRSAATLPQIAQSPLIVLVDQFEEIYSLCQDLNERTAFIENLLHAASERNKQVSVIFTSNSHFGKKSRLVL